MCVLCVGGIVLPEEVQRTTAESQGKCSSKHFHCERFKGSWQASYSALDGKFSGIDRVLCKPAKRLICGPCLHCNLCNPVEHSRYPLSHFINGASTANGLHDITYELYTSNSD